MKSKAHAAQQPSFPRWYMKILLRAQRVGTGQRISSPEQ